MQRSIRLVVLLVCACGGSGTSSAPTPAPTEAAPRAAAAPHGAATGCADRVAGLAAQLRELAAAQPGFLPLVPGIIAPVTSTARPVDTRGIVIAVTRDGRMFRQGQELAAGDVRAYLERVHRTALETTLMMNGGTAADATMPLYLWADAGTPIRPVAAIAAAVEPEPAKRWDTKLTPEEEQTRKEAIEAARAAGILGDSSAERPAPFVLRLIVTSSQSAAPSLPESEPEATRHLGDQLKAAIGMCAPIITAIVDASREGVPAKETEKLATGIPRGLASCSCKVADMAALTAGLRTWFGAWAPSLRWIELPKLGATDQRPIRQLVAR
jgi:hypothetical protein